jgi:hypothetical protein
MKRRMVVALSFLLAWWGLGENHARAQFGQLGSPPPAQQRRNPVSPFVTLGQGGLGAGADYYGIIQPQMTANRNIGQLQYGLNNLDPNNPAAILGLNPANTLGGMQTGHPVYYSNTGHYYPPYPPYPTGTVSGTPGLAGAGYGAGYGGQTGYGGYGAGYGGQAAGQQIRPFYSGTFNSFSR